MTITTTQFNWLPRPSMWQEAQNWTARQQSLRDTMDTVSSLSDNFATASANQYSGLANLAAQAALTRIQAAAKAKTDANQAAAAAAAPSTIAGNSSTITMPDGTPVDLSRANYLPGGSK